MAKINNFVPETFRIRPRRWLIDLPQAGGVFDRERVYWMPRPHKHVAGVHHDIGG